MAALSDPGGFGKGAEKQAETMKGLGIEQTDAKAEAKKKEEENKKKGINPSLSRSRSSKSTTIAQRATSRFKTALSAIRFKVLAQGFLDFWRFFSDFGQVQS